MLENQLGDNLLGHAGFESFFADLTYHAHLYRGWAALANESRPVVRRANIRKRMGWLRRKSRIGVVHVTLSAINVHDLRRIQDASSCDEQAGLKLLLQHLMQVGTGKGRRPLDEIHYLIDGIAQAYMDAFNRNRSCTKEGDFERIATCTLTVASEGRQTSIRPHLEQYCSRAEIEEENSYFRDDGTSVVRPRSFAPPRMTTRGSK